MLYKTTDSESSAAAFLPNTTNVMKRKISENQLIKREKQVTSTKCGSEIKAYGDLYTGNQESSSLLSTGCLVMEIALPP